MQAGLDVSELLKDSDFSEQLEVERSEEVVGDNGLAAFTPQRRKFFGVVTQDRGRMLAREAAGERVSGSIMVITQYALTDGTDGRTADVVRWRGKRWAVMRIGDYGNFGCGFVQASCDLIEISGGRA